MIETDSLDQNTAQDSNTKVFVFVFLSSAVGAPGSRHGIPCGIFLGCLEGGGTATEFLPVEEPVRNLWYAISIDHGIDSREIPVYVEIAGVRTIGTVALTKEMHAIVIAGTTVRGSALATTFATSTHGAPASTATTRTNIISGPTFDWINIRSADNSICAASTCNGVSKITCSYRKAFCLSRKINISSTTGGA